MRQFPALAVNKVTLFIRYYDAGREQFTNVKVPLNGCLWNGNSISLFKETGQQIKNSVEIYIPFEPKVTGRDYISPGEWAKTPYAELNNYWTVDLNKPPIILSGESGYTFSWGTSGEITEEHNKFMRENTSARTVVDFNPMLFGSRHMWHFVIRGV